MILLSQYIGDFQPLVQINGLFEFNLIALICNKFFAIFFASIKSKTIKQMYKVFVNQKVIILTSKPSHDSKYPQLSLKESSLNKVLKILKKNKKVLLVHKNEDKLISKFKKKIKVVKAGGGIVKNQKDETLFIFRRNIILIQQLCSKQASIEQSELISNLNFKNAF